MEGYIQTGISRLIIILKEGNRDSMEKDKLKIFDTWCFSTLPKLP